MVISEITRITLSTLGKLIKTARQQHTLSQRELANRTGTSRQTIMAIERGSPHVSIATVFEVAHIVGIPLLTESKEQLKTWERTLTNFIAILPKRTHFKKVELNDDF